MSILPGKYRPITFLVCATFALPVLAFPPTPHHTLYGMVRDGMGNPIMDASAVVILQTTGAVKVSTAVMPNLAPGMNYRLQVPMDAGLTTDSYKTNALKPTLPFTMKVMEGQTTYLPMELHGSYTNLGKAAQSTHLDLTMGVDSDQDGLPDAWEEELIAQLGSGLALADIRPQDDLDGDGLTNLQEYQAGTYAFDSADGVFLNIVGFNQRCPMLEFMVIRGRCYNILASTNMKAWSSVNFRLPAEASGQSALSRFAATDVRVVRAEALVPATNGAAFFFKLSVQ